MDHSGWYDRKELGFRTLADVQFVAAMGPPGGGRNSVTNRYLRHYSVVSVTHFDNENLAVIFTTLVDWWMKKFDYGTGITKLKQPLVAATLEVWISYIGMYGNVWGWGGGGRAPACLRSSWVLKIFCGH